MGAQFTNLTWWQAFANQNQKKLLAGLLIFFGLIFLLIAIPNHYFFRTYAFDLGIFNNAIYDYAHFRWNDNPVKLYNNILSDHFTLLHLPFSLFSWIFGTYTLILIQVAAVLFGAYGAYKYHTFRSQNPLLALLLLFQFLSIWGLYSAVSYDYHDNVIAAMLVPWFFLYFHQKKWLPALIFYGLILISKENMALWAIFLNLGLAMIYFRDRQQFRLALLLSFIAAVYFIIVVKVIIPALAVGERPYTYILNYAALGNNFSEILITLITRPFYVLGLLFQNHIYDPVADGIKWELHIMVLLSGGFALFFRPAYLFMLLPIYAQKLFIGNFMIWGLNSQYSIEFVPILNIALAEMIIRQPPRRGLIIAWIALGLTFAANARSLDTRVSKWFNRAAIQFFRTKHYRREFSVSTAYEAMKKIPEDAPVSAISPLVPHLAFRDYIFEYPVIGNAQYIILITNEVPYMLTDAEYNLKVEQLRLDKDWEIIFEKDELLVFKRKKESNPEPVHFE